MKNIAVRSLATVRPDIWVFIVSIVAGAAMMLLIHSKGLLIGTGDQAAHLNLARLGSDSLTPGITQVGFMWRPLLHIVLVPFVAIDMLYRTGMAAPLILVPCLGLSAVLLRRILLDLGCDSFWSTVACVIFVSQPYVLYFSVVPMTEMLFITLLLLTTIFFQRWYDADDLPSSLLCAVSLSFAFLARVEGVILFPLITSFVIVGLIRHRTPLPQSLALLLLFLMLAAIGVALTMLYGFVYGTGFLAFLRPSELIISVESAPRQFKSIGIGNLLVLLQHAMWYVVGKPFLALSLLCAPLAFVGRRWVSKIPILLILLSPLIFLGFAILQNRASITVPELPSIYAAPGSGPAGHLLDVRYTLTGITFLIAVPALVASGVTGALRRRGLRKASKIVSSVIIAVLLFVIASNAVRLMTADFSWVTKDRAFAGNPGSGVFLPGEYLREYYDFGYILAAHENNDRTFLTADIPLRRYVHESNYRYYEQVASEPWLFARWVLVSIDGDGRINPFIQRASRLPEFSYYYSLVLDTNRTKVYKLNELALRKSAASLGIPWTVLPSLNRELETWDPMTFYGDIRKSEGY